MFRFRIKRRGQEVGQDATALASAETTRGGRRGRPHWRWSGRLRWSIAVLLLVGMLVGELIWELRQQEPGYHGHLLSEWLEAYDDNNRFSDRPSLQSPYTYKQIDEALDAIGPRAVPHLLRWLRDGEYTKPCIRARLIALLRKHHLDPFQTKAPADRSSLAETGFMYYGSAACDADPTLVKWTHSPDPQTRMIAYEAFFFTRPGRDVFLPVCQAALGEPDRGVQLMAAQWLTERFPEDAKKAGIDKRFPEYYRAWTESSEAEAVSPAAPSGL